jgi:hypothetical protein
VLLKAQKADKIATEELEYYVNIKANFSPTEGIAVFKNYNTLQKILQDIGKYYNEAR